MKKKLESLITVAVPRLVRCSSFLMELAILPHAGSLVSSICVGGAVESIRIYVEVIPRDVTNVVREPVDHVANGRRPENDSIGYESIDDAILNAEAVGSSILGDVIPQNLLLVFGQSVQSLRDALKRFPLPPPALNFVPSTTGDCDEQQSDGRKEKNPENKAIILCKLRKSEDLAKIIATKQNQACDEADCYEVPWRELQALKDGLQDSFGHGVSSNSSTNSFTHRPVENALCSPTGRRTRTKPTRKYGFPEKSFMVGTLAPS